MSLIRKHVAVLQAWACLDLVFVVTTVKKDCRYYRYYTIQSMRRGVSFALMTRRRQAVAAVQADMCCRDCSVGRV